jgi:hypothetical protein
MKVNNSEGWGVMFVFILMPVSSPASPIVVAIAMAIIMTVVVTPVVTSIMTIAAFIIAIIDLPELGIGFFFELSFGYHFGLLSPGNPFVLFTKVNHVPNHELSARIQTLSFRDALQILHINMDHIFVGSIVNCFAKIITEVGETIDNGPNKDMIHIYMQNLQSISKTKGLDSRTKFMIWDVIDLREKYKWVPRRKKAKMVTKAEFKKEADAQLREINNRNNKRRDRHNGGNNRRHNDRHNDRHSDRHNDRRGRGGYRH